MREAEKRRPGLEEIPHVRVRRMSVAEQESEDKLYRLVLRERLSNARDAELYRVSGGVSAAVEIAWGH